MLHSKIDISEMDQDTLHIKLRHTKYQIPHVTHKFAHNINEIKHITYRPTIAHIVDGFGQSPNIPGCNMNEY